MENSVGTVFYMKSSLIYINKEKNAETKKKAVDSVFLPRKKVGFYKKIEFHHIKTLENVFLEVIRFYNFYMLISAIIFK